MVCSLILNSTYSVGPFGEILSLGHSPATDAVRTWYEEVGNYDFSEPRFSEDTGHFTQVVWDGTTDVGCAYVLCDRPNVRGWYLACEYDPRGNTEGNFDENVHIPET
jgi:hypothetical protein